MIINLPTSLTWMRILMIPLLVGIYYVPDAWMSWPARNIAATALFTAAAITDWLDGWLARRLNQTSAFGAFLDPVADKLMVAAALIVLVQLGRTGSWVAAIIIGREIAISALREWMAQLGASKSVAVNMLGKIKTVCQMSAIPLLLFWDPLGPFPTQAAGSVLIYAAAVLTLLSMFYYLKLALPRLRAADKDPS
jgi:CDP-diacylglycerol--glycerol-3-phosphate 3-phosphatidyltransferase/cardiolipin synthase